MNMLLLCTYNSAVVLNHFCLIRVVREVWALSHCCPLPWRPQSAPFCWHLSKSQNLRGDSKTKIKLWKKDKEYKKVLTSQPSSVAYNLGPRVPPDPRWDLISGGHGILKGENPGSSGEKLKGKNKSWMIWTAKSKARGMVYFYMWLHMCRCTFKNRYLCVYMYINVIYVNVIKSKCIGMHV